MFCCVSIYARFADWKSKSVTEHGDTDSFLLEDVIGICDRLLLQLFEGQTHKNETLE